MRIENAAREHGVRVVWKLFLLGPIFRALGMGNSSFVIHKAKGAYVWKDMARQRCKHGLDWKTPTTFPRLAILPARVALLGADEPWIGDFSKRVMLLNFVLDQDINQLEQMTPILQDLGLPAGAVIERAQFEPVELQLCAQTEEARERGIFGAPTLFVGDQMSWGNDRLDDALQHA